MKEPYLKDTIYQTRLIKKPCFTQSRQPDVRSSQLRQLSFHASKSALSTSRDLGLSLQPAPLSNTPSPAYKTAPGSLINSPERPVLGAGVNEGNEAGAVGDGARDGGAGGRSMDTEGEGRGNRSFATGTEIGHYQMSMGLPETNNPVDYQGKMYSRDEQAAARGGGGASSSGRGGGVVSELGSAVQALYDYAGRLV